MREWVWAWVECAPSNEIKWATSPAIMRRWRSHAWLKRAVNLAWTIESELVPAKQLVVNVVMEPSSFF